MVEHLLPELRRDPRRFRVGPKTLNNICRDRTLPAPQSDPAGRVLVTGSAEEFVVAAFVRSAISTTCRRRPDAHTLQPSPRGRGEGHWSPQPGIGPGVAGVDPARAPPTGIAGFEERGSPRPHLDETCIAHSIAAMAPARRCGAGKRRWVLGTLLDGTVAATVACAGLGPGLSGKPIKLIVPFPPGGPTTSSRAWSASACRS